MYAFVLALSSIYSVYAYIYLYNVRAFFMSSYWNLIQKQIVSLFLGDECVCVIRFKCIQCNNCIRRLVPPISWLSGFNVVFFASVFQLYSNAANYLNEIWNTHSPERTVVFVIKISYRADSHLLFKKNVYKQYIVK